MPIVNGLRPAGNGSEFASAGSGACANSAPLDARRLRQEGLATHLAGNGASTSAPAGLGDPQFISRYRWPEGPVMDGTTRVAAMAGGNNVLRPVVPRIIVQVVGSDDTRTVAAAPFEWSGAPVAGVNAGSDLVPKDDLVKIRGEYSPMRGVAKEVSGRMVWGDSGHSVACHREEYSHSNL